MAEAEHEPDTTSNATAPKHSNVSFSVWPPTERTREAVRNRLVETLSSPSILSKRYGTISREEAVDVAKRVEEETFELVGATADTDDDGIEILQVYSKEISKRMLEAVKDRSGESGESGESDTPSAQSVNKPTPKADEEEDAGSKTPPQSEKTDSFSDDE